MGAGRLVVLSGPSGVGKGTVVAGLLLRRPITLAVSATTRPRRPDEVDGRDYHFVDEMAFDRLIADNGLLEWAEYAGRRYGTPAAAVRSAVEEGRDVLLEIEVQGARQVRDRHPEALLVLLVPPSWEELGRRLAARGTENAAAILDRLAAARAELADTELFDHVVVNQDVAAAVAELDRILGLPPPTRS